MFCFTCLCSLFCVLLCFVFVVFSLPVFENLTSAVFCFCVVLFCVLCVLCFVFCFCLFLFCVSGLFHFLSFHGVQHLAIDRLKDGKKAEFCRILCIAMWNSIFMEKETRLLISVYS